jgi:hypothetical protein
MSKGLHQWIARHNQYSTDEAELLMRLASEPISWRSLYARDPIARRRALKQLGARAPLRPFARFLYVYILRGGFLDGSAGFRFCAMRFAHDIHIACKLAEQRDRHRTASAMSTSPELASKSGTDKPHSSRRSAVSPSSSSNVSSSRVQ